MARHGETADFILSELRAGRQLTAAIVAEERGIGKAAASLQLAKVAADGQNGIRKERLPGSHGELTFIAANGSEPPAKKGRSRKPAPTPVAEDETWAVVWVSPNGEQVLMQHGGESWFAKKVDG